MRRHSAAIAVVVALALVGFAAWRARSSSGEKPGPERAGTAVIDTVVDGDTVRVRLGGRVERVRLIGIDTPESVKPDTPVQCFAREASARTKALLPKGQGVRLVADVEQRDRYGRLLAYLYRADDDLFVNLTLVNEGFALPATFPPNVAHTAEFVAAARRAREGRRGLWANCPSTSFES